MLGWRLFGALGLSVPFVFILWLDDRVSREQPGIWLAPMAILLGVAATAEFVGLFVGRVPGLRYGPACGGALLMTAAMSMPAVWPQVTHTPLGLWGWPVLGICLAMAAVMLTELINFSDGRGLAERTAIAFWAVVSIAVPFCCLLFLRIQASGRLGLLLIVSTIFVVKCSDAGAYFVGKSLGKHRLAPRISPGKTWEGVVGGLLAAVVAAWAFHSFVVPAFLSHPFIPTAARLAVYGATLHMAGVLGDLAESMFKRSADKKDSASWLPGLGGILDVIDSVLWAAPVAYLFWAMGFLDGP